VHPELLDYMEGLIPPELERSDRDRPVADRLRALRASVVGPLRPAPRGSVVTLEPGCRVADVPTTRAA